MELLLLNTIVFSEIFPNIKTAKCWWNWFLLWLQWCQQMHKWKRQHSPQVSFDLFLSNVGSSASLIIAVVAAALCTRLRFVETDHSRCLYALRLRNRWLIDRTSRWWRKAFFKSIWKIWENSTRCDSFCFLMLTTLQGKGYLDEIKLWCC